MSGVTAPAAPPIAARCWPRATNGRVSDLAVRLRPVTEDDLSLLEAMHQDREQAGALAWSGFVSRVSLHRKYDSDGFLAPDYGRLVVVVEEQPVGFVSWLQVSHGPPPSRCWNVGISLLPAHRGQGIGGAAQRLLVDYLFSVSDVERIEAGTLTDNLAEQRSLEKAGFHREGVLRSAQFLDGRWRDVVLFSRLRSD